MVAFLELEVGVSSFAPLPIFGAAVRGADARLASTLVQIVEYTISPGISVSLRVAADVDPKVMNSASTAACSEGIIALMSDCRVRSRDSV